MKNNTESFIGYIDSFRITQDTIKYRQQFNKFILFFSNLLNKAKTILHELKKRIKIF